MRNASSNLATDQEVDDEILYNAHLLGEASKKGDVVKVESLIEKLGQKNLDLTDNYSISALMYAAQNGHDNVVRILINAGADVDLTNEDSNALFLATNKGHAEVVNSLIEAEADVNWINIFKQSALMIAVYKGHAEVINSLIKAGADVNFIDRLGESVLLIAAFKGYAEVVNSLIKAGANFCYEALDLTGQTEMRTSIIESVALDPIIDEVKKKEIVSQLLLNGASLSQELLDSSRISDDMKIFVEGHNAPEKIEERDKNLLANKAFQDALKKSILKKSILGGKPHDNIDGKVILEAFKSISAEDLDNTSKKNKIKLRKSGVYQLLKIMNKLSDEDIVLSTQNLQDLKTISDTILPLRNFQNAKPRDASIAIFDNDVMFMLLEHLLPKEPKERLGEELTSELVKSLLEMYSTPPAQIANQSKEPSTKVAGCFSCIRIAVAKMLGSNSEITRP